MINRRSALGSGWWRPCCRLLVRTTRLAILSWLPFILVSPLQERKWLTQTTGRLLSVLTWSPSRNVARLRLLTMAGPTTSESWSRSCVSAACDPTRPNHIILYLWRLWRLFMHYWFFGHNVTNGLLFGSYSATARLVIVRSAMGRVAAALLPWCQHARAHSPAVRLQCAPCCRERCGRE